MAGDYFTTGKSEQDQASWRALTLFSGYRLFLAAILFVVFYLELAPEFIGKKYPLLHHFVSLSYLMVAVLLMIFSSRRWGIFVTQCSIQLIIDIIALALIIHAAGGLQSGLGALLVVVVVAGGALIPGRLAVFIAAIATLSVLLEAVYAELVGLGQSHFAQAGMLGAIFFITAVLAQLLSRTMQRSQLLAEQQAQDLNKLANLNQHIISRMQVAVLVLDEQGKVSLCNQSASQFMGIEHVPSQFLLKQYVPELAEQIWRWKQHLPDPFEPFHARADLPQLLARATLLDSGEVLVFIENTTALAQQAQQLKLASLGRLTASIAHEIRNPLSAISHASELLSESLSYDESVSKLTGIIQRHSVRMNNIIETILEMSRRKNVEPTVVVLSPWLEKLLGEYCEIKHIPHQQITLTSSAPLARICTDEEQLHQVIWNLIDNAWHYADKDQSQPIEVRITLQSEYIHIDVIDNGAGVSPQAMQHLFEPFHSERTGGTGLGLYLARELCQANGARLSYLPEFGSCFRISYPMQRQEFIQ